jgi:predicted MFS family arabinose efflux permease
MRDEVQEIEKSAMSDTKWIRRWRLLLIFMMTATAATVTFVTYQFLEDEQEDNYKESVRQSLCVIRQTSFLGLSTQ